VRATKSKKIRTSKKRRDILKKHDGPQKKTHRSHLEVQKDKGLQCKTLETIQTPLYLQGGRRELGKDSLKIQEEQPCTVTAA